MSTAKGLRLLLLAGLLLLGWDTARAQARDPSEPAAETTSAARAPAPGAIAVEEIPERAGDVEAELLGLVPDAKTRSAVESIDRELTEYAKTAQTRLRESREAFAAAGSVSRLREVETQLQVGVRRFDDWAVPLDAAIARLSRAIQQCDSLAATWERTLDGARAAGASGTTLERVSATQNEIAEAKAQLLERRNEVLAIRQRLVDDRAGIDLLREEVEAAIFARLVGVFHADDLALWQPELWRALSAELSVPRIGVLAHGLRASRDYVYEQRRVIALQLTFLVLLALGLRVLRDRVGRSGDEELDAHASVVFELPVAMALVIVLSATRLVHPLAPTIIMQAVSAVAIVPAILILRRIAPVPMGPLLVSVVLLATVDLARALIESLPTLERLVLVLELACACAFLIWLRRPHRLAHLPPAARTDPVLRFVDFGERAAILLLGAGILSNAVGAVDLGILLGQGALRCAFVGLFAYTFYRVLWSLSVFALRAPMLRFLNLVSRNRPLVLRKIDPVLKLGAGLLWFAIALRVFNVGDIVYGWMSAMLNAQLHVGTFELSLGGVLSFTFALWFSFVLARFVNFVLEEDVFPRGAFGRGVPYAVSSLVRYTVLFLGFFIAMAAGGLELSKLSVIIGGLGVGIGFGLQNVVNNFVSGLILLFERPLQVGDSVQVPADGLAGRIVRIGIRASTLRTGEGAEVIVPNGALISGSVINWTLTDRTRRVELTVGVEHGNDAQAVIDLLEGVAQKHGMVLRYPPPRAYFMGFGENSLGFRLDLWIGDVDDELKVRSDLGVHIQRALQAAAIAVALPQRDLHLRSISPGVASELESQLLAQAQRGASR